MQRSARQHSPARSSCDGQPHRAGSGTGTGTGTGGKQTVLEGVLKKYTNLLQGWQSRYFVLDPEVGQLQYYLDELCKKQQSPRGCLPLPGAVVVSSQELPHVFTVRSTAGDFYRLRALDAQDQELWVAQLQLYSRCYSAVKDEDPEKSSAEVLPARDGPVSSPDEDRLLPKTTSTLGCFRDCLSMLQQNGVRTSNRNQNHIPRRHGSRRSIPVVDQVESGGVRWGSQGLNPSCRQTWTPKACSREGTDHSVQNQNQNQSPGLARAEPDLDRPVELPGLSSTCSAAAPPLTDPPLCVQVRTGSSDTPDPNNETTDSEDNEEEEELGVQDDERSIITHLLSQLKLGMDLTQVVLPTFILEKHSLLEMYANFMAHPDIFLSITSGCTSEERIIRFVRYYLTAFHEGRRGAVAKKPYNPVLGENFRCSWLVPREGGGPPPSSQGGGSDSYSVGFVAEQVSHHPPVSAFYCECKEKQMCVNTHVWTKSKFTGMSVGVSMVGEGVLYLLEHDEEYVFTLPCAYARSILTMPWMELGGKVSIVCAKSGYSASITFHTKPLCGGKVHRVTAEVMHNQSRNVVCKAQGEWNGMLEFSYKNGDRKVIDTSKLPVIKKRIRPLHKQEQFESRHLWQHVTASLKAGNMEAATEHKHFLEERQRREEKQRAATKTAWKPKYFIKEGEGWVFRTPLWKAH